MFAGDHLFMILKSYFDGASDFKHSAVTLAMVCGASEHWSAFENDWEANLVLHAAPFLHTTDAVSGQAEYSGWDRVRVDAFVSGCVDVAKKHLGAANKDEVLRPGLLALTLRIPLDDYRRARNENPHLPNSVREILLSEVLSFAFRWGRSISAEWHHLYFDQGESYYGHALDRKNSRRARKQITDMWKVAHLVKANMRFVPALQLADLFAWCISHNDVVTREWHDALHKLDWLSLYLDYGYLKEPTPGALERTANWELTRRKVFPNA